MHYALIIAAGGSGTRMEADIPKQFLLIAGKPVIIHTLEKFIATGMVFDPIIIACPHGFHAHCQSIMSTYLPGVAYILSAGGETRFHSIQNTLSHIKQDTLVAVHDAARPCVSADLIQEAFDMAKQKQSAIPVVPVKESIRVYIDGQWRPADRTLYKIVQTPQIFHATLLKQAYMQQYSHEFTDDATVVEKSGGEIHYINGEDTNIKITLPHDLEIASVYLKAIS